MPYCAHTRGPVHPARWTVHATDPAGRTYRGAACAQHLDHIRDQARTTTHGAPVTVTPLNAGDQAPADDTAQQLDLFGGAT